MSKKNIVGFMGQWLPTAFVIICCTIIAGACSKFLSQTSTQPSPTPQNAVPSSNAKLMLNTEERGTTNDTSILEKDLARLFEQRARFNEPERTVYIVAENSLRVTEVAKVVEAIRKVGVGAS